MTTSVTTLLFDLDETICHHPQSGPELLEEAFAICGLTPFFSYEDYVEEVEKIGGTASDVRRRETCYERLARADGRSADVGRRLALVYEGLADYTAVEFVPEAESVLGALAREYRLGLVTNGGPDTQSPKIDSLGIRDRFETVVIAGEDPPAKPDPTPFRYALDDLGVSPEETVYVCNSLSSDVAGAAASGIESVWIPWDRRAGEPPDVPDSRPAPDYTRRSLSALLDEPWR